MANPTLVQSGSNSLASAASTLTVGTLADANVDPGDLAIAWCTAERGSVTPTAPAGWTQLGTPMTSTNSSTGVYYKRLGAGDLSAVITFSVSSTRRLSGGFVAYRGSLDPVISQKAAVNTSTTTATANSMTPTVADSTLLTLYASVSVSSPWIRTFSAYTSGWTEQVQISGTAAALSDPFSTLVSKDLTGGSGVSQGFSGASISSPSEYVAMSIVLAPGTVNVAPNAYLVANQTDDIEPGQTITMTISDDDDVTPTGSLTRTFRQILPATGPGSSLTVTGSGGNGSTRSIVAPYTLDGVTLTFGYKVNDGTLDSTEAVVGLEILRPTDFLVTVGGATPTLVPLEKLVQS